MAVVQAFRVISEFLSSMKCLGSSSPKDLIIFMTKLVVSPWNWKFLSIYAAKIRLHVRTMWIRRVEPGCHVFTHVPWLREWELRKNHHPEKFRAAHSTPEQVHLVSHCYSQLTAKITIVIWIWPHTSYQFSFFFFWCDNSFWLHRVSAEPISAPSIIKLNTVPRTIVTMFTV